MSDKPAISTKHPASKGPKSGEHPSVQKYRAKIESIDEGATTATNKLDQMLEEFLIDLRTPVPTGPPTPTPPKP